MYQSTTTILLQICCQLLLEKNFNISDSTTLSFAVNQSVWLQDDNNLSTPQKELILWYQRLFHASVSWVQILMRDHKWLKSNYSENYLHQEPFIPCKEPRTPNCDAQGLKCAACQTAKICTWFPESHESHNVLANNVRNKFDKVLEEKKTQS